MSSPTPNLSPASQEWVRAQLDAAPPLSRERLDRLAVIMRPAIVRYLESDAQGLDGAQLERPA